VTVLPESFLVFAFAALIGTILILGIALLLLARGGRNAERFNALAQGNERLERELRQAVDAAAGSVRGETGARLMQLQTAFGMQGTQALEAQAKALAAYGQAQQQQLADLTRAIQLNLTEVRATLQTQLTGLQQGNEAKLEQMRATVEEKLQSTLEARLGESFKQVSDRLEQVHRGLGEMQGLAQGVGDLKRVLTNVKTRGSFGEVQLAALLEQVLTADQYAANIATRPNSDARVEFAVKMPGRGTGAATALWLPIDAKFPTEDYERLVAAQEAADANTAHAAAQALETRIRNEAKKIRDKYVEPPYTTDFAILFLPTEGLFAEVLRRPGLAEALNRELRVVVAGPTTLFALLNSLQMGFRTLAIEQRSVEVRELLGAVKTEFERFGEWIGKVRSQVATVSKTLEDADTRTRQMQRKLRGVEALPAKRAAQLLPPAAGEDG
jgi:DNA recombination protein RmuC